MHARTQFFVIISLILVIFACSNSAKQATHALKADAGPDLKVNAQDAIVLDAGDSSIGASVSYSWDIVSGPADSPLFTGSLRNRHEELTAPAVSSQTVWIVELTVHDGSKTAKDQTEITVTPVNTHPIPDPKPLSTVIVTLSSNPNQGGVVEGGGEYVSGSSVSLKAIPKPGYGFDSWTENGIVVSSESIYTIIVDKPRNLVANFLVKGDGPFIELENGDGQVVLNWPGSASIDSYNLYYAKESPVSPDTIGLLSGGSAQFNINNTSVTVTGLENGSDYYFIITSMSGNVESNPSNQVGARPRSPQFKRPKLNDTGITKCADNTTIGNPCPVSGFWYQDAEYGRDALNSASALVKVGSGKGGFDFSKISDNGHVLASNATSWNCVHDNVTDLFWEVKTIDAGLRDMRNTYLWTTAADFATNVNKQGLCGYNDWRVPSSQELISIADFSIGTPGPDIDTDFFPNTMSDHYWTSSISAVGTDAFTLDFSHGVNWLYDRNTKYYYIRLVRGGL